MRESAMESCGQHPAASYHVRWMIRRDMPEVLEIEQLCFPNPWSEEDFIRALRQRNCIGRVVEIQDAVVGFVIYEMHKTKLHVLNLAVHPSCQRRGVGWRMVSDLIAKLSLERRTRIALEVRESNLDALLFFRAMGFRAVMTLRYYYDDVDEDAVLMQYRLPREIHA